MKKKILFFLFAFGFFSFFVCFFPRLTLAARLNLDPYTQEVIVGEEFQVNVSLDTQDKNVNGVQTKILFDQGLLEIVTVNFSGIFPANFESIDNINGEVQIGSGEDLPTASFNGSSTWVTLTLKAKSSGFSELRFSCPDSAILELEMTNNLLDCSSLSSGNYVIRGKDQSVATPTSVDLIVTCADPSPETPTNLSAVSGSENGQMILTWTKTADADHYGLVFGSESRNYQYGAVNIGNTNQYLVEQLTPGELYYFAVFAVKGCAASGFSGEASARAKITIGETVSPSGLGFSALIYQPIEEVFSEVAFPETEKTPTPTPVPMIEVEEEPTQLGKKILVFGLPLIILIIFLVVLRLYLKQRRKSKLISSPEPSQPFSSPQTPAEEEKENPVI